MTAAPYGPVGGGRGPSPALRITSSAFCVKKKKKRRAVDSILYTWYMAMWLLSFIKPHGSWNLYFIRKTWPHGHMATWNMGFRLYSACTRPTR
jgi:hypothetical protein